MKISILAILALVLAGCSRPHHVTASTASAPTFNEQDVRAFVTQRRTIAEITNRFGVPINVITNDGHIEMWFVTPINPDQLSEAHPFGFFASFTNGIFEKWQAVPVRVHPPK